MMCLLCVSFDGGCTVWALQPPNTGCFVVNPTAFSLIAGTIKILCKSGWWISRLKVCKLYCCVVVILNCGCADVKVRVMC